MQSVMAWYYELFGKNDVLLQKSQPVYKTNWEAQWAGYRSFKDKEAIDGGLRLVPLLENIRVREKDN